MTRELMGAVQKTGYFVRGLAGGDDGYIFRSQFKPSAEPRAVGVSVLIVALLFAGCEKPTKGVVSGVITVDNSPAKSGSIAFFPLDQKSTTAGGEILDGRYTAEVPFGKFSVEIRVPKVVGEKKLYDTPNSPIMPLLEETLPAKYNDQTELTIDVQPGKNQRDFPLSTR